MSCTRVWVQRGCVCHVDDERVHPCVCAQVRREVYALGSPHTVSYSRRESPLPCMRACGAIAVGPPKPIFVSFDFTTKESHKMEPMHLMCVHTVCGRGERVLMTRSRSRFLWPHHHLPPSSTLDSCLLHTVVPCPRICATQI